MFSASEHSRIFLVSPEPIFVGARHNLAALPVWPIDTYTPSFVNFGPGSRDMHQSFTGHFFHYRTQVRFFFALSVISFFTCYSNISGKAERICAKFTGKTCLVPRSDEFEFQGQRSRSPATKRTKKSAESSPLTMHRKACAPCAVRCK